MNAEAKSTSTELTLVERAQVALQSQENERKLKELAQASKSITAITNKAGYDQCHSSRMALKKMRVDIEKVGKSAREDAQAFSKAVIAEQSRLIGLIQPEEARLEAIQKVWDDEREREKQAKAETERKRVAAIRERIDEIRQRPADAAGQSSEEIELYITALVALDIGADFAEFQQEAAGAKETALVRLRSAHGKALAHEEEQRQLAAEREQLARERAERERIDSIRKRIQNITSFVDGASLLHSTRVQLMLDQARAMSIDDSFADLRGEAQAALEESVRTLERVHHERKSYEDEQQRLAADRAAIAEQERQAREERAADDRRQRELESLNQGRLEEIQGIQHQFMIATSGRLGVRRGGTRECIVDTLEETRSWPVTAERFGPVFFGAAQKIKADTITKIEQVLADWDERARQADEATRLAAEREALEAEKQKQAEATAADAPIEADDAAVEGAEIREGSVRQASDTPFDALSFSPGIDWALSAIKEKRLRQIAHHGYQPAQDDDHIEGEIARAAIPYIQAAYQREMGLTDEELRVFWPWDGAPNLKQPRLELMLNAAALLVADIERLDRADK